MERRQNKLGAGIRLPGVNDTGQRSQTRCALYTEDPSTLLPRVIQYAEFHALRIVSLNTLGPSLEDVFLEITGGQMGAVANESQEEKPAKRGMGGGRK